MLMAKLFSITVVILTAIASIAFVALLLTGFFSVLPLPMFTHSDGIVAVSGGLSEKLPHAALLVGVLCYLLWSWRRRRKLR